MTTKSTNPTKTTKGESKVKTSTIKPNPTPTIKGEIKVKAPTQPTKPIHPLALRIPDKAKYYDTYVGRSINGVEDITILDEAAKSKFNTLIGGPTGSAKTSLVYAFAAYRGLPLVNIACNGAIDPRTLFGGWVPDADGGFKYEPGDLVLAVQHGGVILINECNFAPPKILASLYGLLDRRRDLTVNEAAGSDHPTVVHAHDDCFIVADYNPDYIGTRPLSEAFINRFPVKLHWGYNRDVEDTLVASSVLQDMADSLRERHALGEISGTVPTNLLMEFLDIAENPKLGMEFAISNFVNSFPENERALVAELFLLNKTPLNTSLGIGE